MGGAIAAVESSYMKSKLVESNTARLEAIERGEQVVVGVNRFTETEASPLAAGDGAILTVPHEVEAEQVARLEAWRAAARRDERSRPRCRSCAPPRPDGRNVMPASIAAAKAGVTTGEWGAALREAFGEYRAPTGVGRAARQQSGGLDEVRAGVERVSRKLGRRIKFLVGKPGLDGHSNGAEQIAVRARDAGMEVVYEGIRLTPAEIVNAALEEGVHVVGLSILSGSHVPLVNDVVARMRAAGLDDVPVIVGGIIPPDDASDAEGRRRRGGLHAEGFRIEPHHGGHRAHRGCRRRQGGVDAPTSHSLSRHQGVYARLRGLCGRGWGEGLFPRATRRRGSPHPPQAFGLQPAAGSLPAARGEGKTPARPGSPASRRKAFMPAASAASTSAGSVRPDTPMMRTPATPSGSARIARAASRPSRPGRVTSISTMS